MVVGSGGGGGQRHRRTLFGILLQFCAAACMSQTTDVHTALFEEYVKSKGHGVALSLWRERTEQLCGWNEGGRRRW